jgi:hypothetical protein
MIGFLTEKNIFSIIAFIIVVGFLATIAKKQETIKQLNEQINAEKTSNNILRNSIDSLVASTENKDRIIRQLESDNQLKDDTIKNLSESVKKTNESVVSMKKRLDSITVKPTTEVSPYIREALKQVGENK